MASDRPIISHDHEIGTLAATVAVAALAEALLKNGTLRLPDLEAAMTERLDALILPARRGAVAAVLTQAFTGIIEK